MYIYMMHVYDIICMTYVGMASICIRRDVLIVLNSLYTYIVTISTAIISLYQLAVYYTFTYII